MRRDDVFEVAIVGTGVSGASDAYMLSHFTNVKRIAIFEKYSGVALVNSHPRNNSQTLHFGDTETNYPLPKALKQKMAAGIVARYIETKGAEEGLFRKTYRMVLAVGREEVALLKERYEVFRHHYPGLKLLGREGIAEIEPKVMEGRDERVELAALVSDEGYAVNYKKLAEDLLSDTLNTGKDIRTFFDTSVERVRREGDLFVLETEKGTFRARVVIFTAGPYSLVFAQSLGHGKDLEILSVAGSFYFTRRVLNGKVYTMQIDGVPFAAIHGDPDVVNPNTTRFGPTTKVVFEMERRNPKTFFDYIKTPIHTWRGIKNFMRVIFHGVPFWFVVKNIGYDVPVLGKWMFLRSIRKIIPSIRYRDLTLGKELGGVRPQVIDMRTGKLQMGEARIAEDSMIANTTPSPGASSSMKNGVLDALQAVAFLGEGYTFHVSDFIEQFPEAADILKEG